ncbi:MAG: methylmalonyl-CoA mutase family protein, partial [Acidimicrobiales bacterium]
PTERAARIALRTQQVIAHETGAADVADPLGGSYYVEWMTDELERQAEAIFDHLRGLGHGSMLEGVYAGIDAGWFQGEIAGAAYRLEKRVNAGRRVVVGVNRHTGAGDDGPLALLSIGPEVEARQRARLDGVKRRRDQGAVDAALATLVATAGHADANLMPGLIDAARSRATLGEVIDALAAVFGRHVEDPVI